MTDEQLIQMAKQAGMIGDPSPNTLLFLRNLLVMERNRVADKISRLPFGDTAASFAVYVRQA